MSIDSNDITAWATVVTGIALIIQIGIERKSRAESDKVNKCLAAKSVADDILTNDTSSKVFDIIIRNKATGTYTLGDGKYMIDRNTLITYLKDQNTKHPFISHVDHWLLDLQNIELMIQKGVIEFEDIRSLLAYHIYVLDEYDVLFKALMDYCHLLRRTKAIRFLMRFETKFFKKDENHYTLIEF